MNMANQKLDSLAVQEIRAAVSGLKGKPLTDRIHSLAARFGVSIKAVYAVTDDLRPRRKARADKGERRADLLAHDGLALAAELVATRNVDPDHAIEVAELNGHEIPVSLETFRKYLREHGLNKQQRRNPVRAHRRWEASEPCEIFQFDISAVKERWFDLTTRRILKVSAKDVNENHPNTNPDRVNLWKFTLIDDYSRRRFVRFYAVSKPTSIEVIDFLLAAFRRLGVPQTLYTDNDAIIVSKRMQRAEGILDRSFEASGGFRLLQHAPYNAQATGKVERSHQVIEKFEKLIGIKFQTPTLDALNHFCEQVCEALDWKASAATGEKPMLRWRASNTAMRVPPPEVLDWAFKCEEFECRLNADLTIRCKGASWQVPRKRPFVDWITQKVCLIWPAGDSKVFYLIGLDGIDYEIEKKPATADPAGEFKQPAESTRQRSLKRLQERAKARQAQHKQDGSELLVPGFDAPFKQNAEPRPAVLPKQIVEMPVEKLAEVVPGAASARFLKFWPALRLLVDEGALTTSDEDKAWLRQVFNGREDVADQEIRAAVNARTASDATNVVRFERRA